MRKVEREREKTKEERESREREREWTAGRWMDLGFDFLSLLVSREYFFKCCCKHIINNPLSPTKFVNLRFNNLVR